MNNLQNALPWILAGILAVYFVQSKVLAWVEARRVEQAEQKAQMQLAITAMQSLTKALAGFQDWPQLTKGFIKCAETFVATTNLHRQAVADFTKLVVRPEDEFNKEALQVNNERDILAASKRLELQENGYSEPEARRIADEYADGMAALETPDIEAASL